MAQQGTLTKGAAANSSTHAWRRYVFNLAGLALAVVLVVLIARAADWRAVGQQIRNANIPLLIFCWVVVGGLSWLLRAARWRVLLNAGQPIPFWPVFWANSAGNLGNYVLPARAGEFIRTAMISFASGLSKRFVLATIASERIFDLLVFITLTEIAVWYAPAIPTPIRHAINIAVLLALVGVGATILASRLRTIVDLVFDRILRKPATAEKIWLNLQPIAAGASVMHSFSRSVIFGILSILIWLLDAGGAILVASALGIRLPLPVAFVLIAALVCINLVPAAPGQLGIYQWVAIRILALAGIEYNQALSYSLILQAGGYIVLSVLGFPGLWMYRRNRHTETAAVSSNL